MIYDPAKSITVAWLESGEQIETQEVAEYGDRSPGIGEGAPQVRGRHLILGLGLHYLALAGGRRGRVLGEQRVLHFNFSRLWIRSPIFSTRMK